MLLQKTGLAPLLKQAQPGRDTRPERAARLVLRLLALEREGRHHELMDSRLCPSEGQPHHASCARNTANGPREALTVFGRLVINRLGLESAGDQPFELGDGCRTEHAAVDPIAE